MRAHRVLVAVLLPLVLLAACGDDDDRESRSTTTTTATTLADRAGRSNESGDALVFGPDDDETEVEVAVDSSFEVALEICSGCGYTWKVLTKPDPDVIDLTSEGEVEGVYVFHFDALEEGTTILEVGYLPPDAGAPEDTYTLTVHADDGSDGS